MLYRTLLRGTIFFGIISGKTDAKLLTKNFFLFPQNRLFQKEVMTFLYRRIKLNCDRKYAGAVAGGLTLGHLLSLWRIQ